MTKVLIGFFLSLGILLSGGYNQLYAHTHQDGGRYAVSENHGRSENTGDDQNIPPQTTTFAFSGVEKGKHKIEVTEIEEKEESEEEEEEEKVITRKHSENAHSVTAIFYTRVIGYLSGYSIKSSRFGECLSDITSNWWYILFRVIRI